MENILRRSPLLFALVAAFALVLGPRPAVAQAFAGAPSWSAAGSTGVADESSASIAAFDNTGGLGIKATAPAGSVAVVRYPVNFLPSHFYMVHSGYFHVLDHLRLTMTFRKPDDGSYASATLKRVRLSDGAVSSVASVNTFGSAPGAAAQQLDKAISCGEDVPCITPTEYAYYIEVVLWKPESANDPQLVALRVYTATN